MRHYNEGDFGYVYTWATMSDGSYKLMDPADLTLTSSDSSVIEVGSGDLTPTYAVARVPTTGAKAGSGLLITARWIDLCYARTLGVGTAGVKVTMPTPVSSKASVSGGFVTSPADLSQADPVNVPITLTLSASLTLVDALGEEFERDMSTDPRVSYEPIVGGDKVTISGNLVTAKDGAGAGDVVVKVSFAGYTGGGLNASEMGVFEKRVSFKVVAFDRLELETMPYPRFAGSMPDVELNIMGCTERFQQVQAALMVVTSDGSKFEITRDATYEVVAAGGGAPVVSIDADDVISAERVGTAIIRGAWKGIGAEDAYVNVNTRRVTVTKVEGGAG